MNISSCEHFCEGRCQVLGSTQWQQTLPPWGYRQQGPGRRPGIPVVVAFGQVLLDILLAQVQGSKASSWPSSCQRHWPGVNRERDAECPQSHSCTLGAQWAEKGAITSNFLPAPPSPRLKSPTVSRGMSSLRREGRGLFVFCFLQK